MFACCTNNKNANKRHYVLNLSKISCIFVFFILIFAFLIFMPNYYEGVTETAGCEASEDLELELQESTDDILDDIDFGEIEDMLNEIDLNQELFGGKSFKDFVKAVIAGEEAIDINVFLRVIMSSIGNALKEILSPLLIILVIILLCNMFNNIKASKITGVGEIIYFICFSVVVIMVSTLSASVVEKAKNGLVDIQRQMGVVFPILVTLMTTMGGIVSVKAYTPMFAFLNNIISSIFLYVLLPLFSFSLILSIVGNLSDNTKLTKLNGFVSSLFKWIIGVVFAVFMAFLSIKGITAGASDGISTKATKYAIKNYIPMLGGYISDGFELVKAGGMLVKNATGFASILLLFLSILSPILSIAVLELGLKLLAGVVEPVGDSKSSSLLYSIAKSLKLLVVILVGVSLMYFLTMFLVMCSVSNVV